MISTFLGYQNAVRDLPRSLEVVQSDQLVQRETDYYLENIGNVKSIEDLVQDDRLFAYAMTKRMLYVGLQAIQRQFGGSYLYVVPSTLYGPEYHTDDRQLHFIFDLIRKILRGKYFGEPVVLWGDGEQTRELIYLDDFIHSLLDLSERCENDIVNIGTGDARSIKCFAQKICEIVRYPFEDIQFDQSRYVGARSKFLNIERLKLHAPSLRFTELDEGLSKTIHWFEQHMPWKKSET